MQVCSTFNVVFSYVCRLPSSLAKTSDVYPDVIVNSDQIKSNVTLKKNYGFPCNFKNSLDCVVYTYVFFTTHLQVPLPGVLHVLHGAAVDFLQTLLPPLVLRLQLVQLHPQVLSLLVELVLQLLQRRLWLGQLHFQTLLQQGDLEKNTQWKKK